MAVASTFLILARGTDKAMSAGLRYVLIHFMGGLILLAGIVLHITQTGNVEYSALAMGERNLAHWLMLAGILVNAAAPPLHAWLSDSYPEATVTGGVILSAYTTKTAVYTLIRGYPGWEILIVIGCIMSLYGIMYAPARKRHAPHPGLLHHQPGGLHGLRGGHRHGHEPQRRRGPRLLPHHLQGPFCG